MEEYEKGTEAINEAFEQISNREPDLEDNLKDMNEALAEEDYENLPLFPFDHMDEEDDEERFEGGLPKKSDTNYSSK